MYGAVEWTVEWLSHLQCEGADEDSTEEDCVSLEDGATGRLD